MKNILRQIDQNLLINYPTLWATKLHYFLPAYFCLLVITYFIGFALPMDTTNVPNIESQFFFSLLLSGIVYMIWAYKAGEFQVTKQFGNTNILAQLRTQGIYLVITCMLGIVPFIYSNILAKREANLVSEKELIYDCNVLNMGMYYLNVAQIRTEDMEGDAAQINETQMPVVNFYKEFSLYGGLQDWNEEQIIAHIGKNTKEQMSQIQAFIETAQKYGGYINATAEEIHANFKDGSNNYHFQDNYEVSNKLRYISKAQTGTLFIQEIEFQSVSIFVAFLVVFTLFTFVATSLRTFVIAIITGIVGSIVLALIGSFSIYLLDIHGNDENLFGFAYLLIVGALTLFGISAGTKPGIILAREVALSISTVLTPFVPVATMMMLDIKLNKYDYDTQMYVYEAIIYFVLAFSTIGTWLIWNVLYRPQLLKIQTIPVRN